MLGRIEESVDRERRLIDRASHELRTPLAVQRIDLDLALSGPATAAALTAALRSVSEENEHLTRLTEDLLVLSRSRDGTLPVRPARTSLAGLADDARIRASATAPPGTRLAVTAEDAVVLVDPAWFRQAIGNLVDNALRHTPPGGEVGVRLSADHGTVLLTVEDTGPGFGAGLASRAFEPFAPPGAPGSRPGLGRPGTGCGPGHRRRARRPGLGGEPSGRRGPGQHDRARRAQPGNGPARVRRPGTSVPRAPARRLVAGSRAGSDMPVCTPERCSR